MDAEPDAELGRERRSGWTGEFARWARAGEARPALPVRRPLVRLLVALTSSTALLAIAGVTATLAIIPPLGARRAAQSMAQREVEAQLAAGETVVASVFASQRRWTDVFRESFGLLVATDRRLLYIGAPPTPLLRPRDDGPDELLVESYPYDGAFTLEPATLLRGVADGLRLRTPSANVGFVVDPSAVADAARVAAAAADARRAATERDAALAAGTVSAAPVAQEYVTHLVQRGETLIGLARRFRTSPDVLRQLNQLTGDDIRSGQRLRVPRVELTSP